MDCSDRWADAEWESTPPTPTPISIHCTSIVSWAHLAHLLKWWSLLSFFVSAQTSFPSLCSHVIMWGFIWLIKAPSLWAISQRTWISSPISTLEPWWGQPGLLHSVDCGGSRNKKKKKSAYFGVDLERSILLLNSVPSNHQLIYAYCASFAKNKFTDYNKAGCAWILCIAMLGACRISRRTFKCFSWRTLVFRIFIYNTLPWLNRHHFVCINHQLIC